MSSRWFAVVVALALGFQASSQGSQAATLSLVSTWQFHPGGGLVAPDGSSPFPFTPPPNDYPVPIPAAPGFATGTMDVTGDSLSFSLSMLSDASPFIAVGTYGPSAIPITLELDEISVTGSGTFMTYQPGVFLAMNPGTGAARGKVTLGATTVPFSVSGTTIWGADGAPFGAIHAGVNPGPPTVGLLGDVYNVGGFIYSGVGFQDPLPLPAVDGVNFSLGAGAAYWGLTFVPEPSAAALFAVTMALVLLHSVRSGVAGRRSSALGRGTT